MLVFYCERYHQLTGLQFLDRVLRRFRDTIVLLGNVADA